MVTERSPCCSSNVQEKAHDILLAAKGMKQMQNSHVIIHCEGDGRRYTRPNSVLGVFRELTPLSKSSESANLDGSHMLSLK